jgi:hypothetical protein
VRDSSLRSTRTAWRSLPRSRHAPGADFEISPGLEGLSHLHPNCPSDQLSWRTPCRTLIHEMSAAAAHPLAPLPGDTDASEFWTQSERISAEPTDREPQRQTPMPSPLLPTNLPSRSLHANTKSPVNVSRASEAQKPLSLSPLVATLTHSLSRNPFACHSYANTRDGCATPPKFFSFTRSVRCVGPVYGEVITTFRINTYKSVSKQTTLTSFRMNTCEKMGGRGA